VNPTVITWRRSSGGRRDDVAVPPGFIAVGVEYVYTIEPVGDTDVPSNEATFMKASFERKLIRWIHIIFSIPIVGYIYGPVSRLEPGASLVKFVFFPTIVLSGLWLWKGAWMKKWVKVRSGARRTTAVRRHNPFGPKAHETTSCLIRQRFGRNSHLVHAALVETQVQDILA
jgi:hypothetical protein